MQEFLDKMTFEDRLRWEQIQREKRAIALRNNPEIRALVEKRKTEQRQKDAAKPDQLIELEATFAKNKSVIEVKTTKPDNNGWGKDFTGKSVDWDKQDSILVNHDTTKPKKQRK